MEMMKAIAVTGPGQGASAVQMSVAVPEVANQEVRVKVKAVGVGSHDRWFMPRGASFPHPIGLEAAGVIEKVGSGVSNWQAGDRVMLNNSVQAKGGTWAEFTVVPATTPIRIPDELGFSEAAALPVAGGTALESIRSLGLSEGNTVFIAGASGAIGTLVVQLARSRGWRVAGSASAANQDHLLSIGAELAVDYRDPAWQQKVIEWAPGGVDAALAILPGTALPCLPVVKNDGKIVTVSGDQVTPERGVTVEQIGHHPEKQRELAELAAAAASGSIRVVVERVYPFEEALEALAKTETGHARGKLVVNVG